jgi:glycosyltransferase involved in cell wall biosynthesis
MKNNVLFLFTNEFPFGLKSEIFLEKEIIFLAKKFDKIIIINKISAHDTIREIPENCIIHQLKKHEQRKKISKFLICLLNLNLFVNVLKIEIKDKGIKKVISKIKFLSQLVYSDLLLKNEIKEIINSNKSENNIFYTYWCFDYIIALSQIKRVDIITRIHGYDLYDDQWDYYGVPLINYRLEKVNLICPISKNGEQYLKRNYPNYSNKIRMHKLGISIQEEKILNKGSKRKYWQIVSCSSIIELKRLDLIIELLNVLDVEIYWTHFGDGPLNDQIQRLAKKLPANIKTDFKGHVTNTEIIKYYKKNKVDLFISTSQSEGIPVSMMEAQSFGIPIIAKNVGGVGEIVLEKKTGFFFDENNVSENNSKILIKALNYNFNRLEIIHYFKKNFNENTNYSKFIDEISLNMLEPNNK